jgi:molybdopterin converting factor small subunit
VNAEVNIPQFLQHLVNGKTVVKVTGNTVGECLDDVVRQFPQLKERVFTKRGKLLQYLEVFVNGKTSYPQELSMPVRESDSLHITNIIEGG